MATSKAAEQRNDLLMCQICQLPYNEPKRLPCMHTFCKACLVYHAKVNAVTTHDDQSLCLFCPLCRQLCELPIRNGVDSLPDNHLLRSLMETIHSKAPHYCDACTASAVTSPPADQLQQQQQQDGEKKKKGKRSSSKKRRQRSTHCCVKCEEFLCDWCTLDHRQQRTTAEHLVVSVGAMKELCQVMTAEQLQKPKVSAKLVTKFPLALPSAGETGLRRPRQGDRGRLGADASTSLDPVGLAMSKADELIVSNAGDASVILYDVEGRFVRRIDQTQFVTTRRRDDDRNDGDTGTGNAARAAAAAAAAAAEADKPENKIGCVSVTAEGYIAVALGDDVTTANGDRSARRIAVVQSLAGRLVSGCDVSRASGSKGEVPAWPYGIATTENGHVIVSDAANHCVFVFDADFRLVRRFGRRGSRNKQFKSPRHLAIAHNNDILVSDYGNHCIKVFTLGGDFRFKIGGVGRDPGRFLHPAGICIDRFGNVFAADRDNHRVQMFDKTGKYISSVLGDTCSETAGRDVRPLDVAVTSQTRLVVLLTGVEGLEFVEVRVYQLRAALPPPEVRSVEQILSTIRALRRSTSSLSARLGSAAGADDGDAVEDGGEGRKVRFRLHDESRKHRRRHSAAATAAGGSGESAGEGGGRGANSQVCVII